MTVKRRTGFPGRRKRLFNRFLSVLLAITLVLPYVPSPMAWASGAETVAKWSFVFSGNPGSVDLPVMSIEGQGGGFSHAKASTVSHTSSNKSLYTNGWEEGDYWQVQLSTLGYSQLAVSWQQWGTNTGPRDFKLQYSLDGANFADVQDAGGSTVYQINTTVSSAYQRDLPGDLDDQPSVYLRWTVASGTSINGGSVAPNGNSRMAEISVTGFPVPADSSQTARPDAGKITLTDNGEMTGQAGSVAGGAQVFVYLMDPGSVVNAVYGWFDHAAPDGSFGPIQINLGGASDTWVTAMEEGKTESSAVKISVAQTAVPVADRITFHAGKVTGIAGAVPGNSTVTAYFDDNSFGGDAVSDPDGSFELTLTNPDNKTQVYITAKETGKKESEKVLIPYREQYKPGDIVISQFYPNAGNSGAFYKTKFVELYNTTDRDIDFNGEWSIQYGSATGTSLGTNSNTRIVLTGTIKARGYYLVTGNSGNNGADLPVAADKTSTLNPSGSTGGILALAHTTNSISSQDDPNLIDLLAYGNGTNTDFAFKTDKWGSPLYLTNVSAGTILRKTDAGSDPRGVIGAGNGWFTRNPSQDFVMNIPMSTNDPKEIVIRNSTFMAMPDASRINFTDASGTATVTGAAGSVPANATVRVHVSDNQGIIPNLTEVGTAVADASGAFTLNFANTGNAQSVFVTHADPASASESAYARIDLSPDPGAVLPIGDLRAVDSNGMPLHIGYRTVIEGVATTANQALGEEPANFHLQDPTGGINVIGGKDPSALGAGTPVVPGKKFKVSGYPVLAAGTLQFVAQSIDYTGDDAVPAPANISLADLSDMTKAEPQEGKLVAVSGKLTNIPALGPDYDLTVSDDDGNSAIVRILGKTGIDVQQLGLGESFRFIGILAQSKRNAPYDDGYVVLPRTSADVRGELQLSHQPLEKAYIGFDVHFRAQAKYADEVAVYYKAESDPAYKSVLMTTADGQNYNGKIPKANVPEGKFYYYIEASTLDGQKKNVGSSAQPFEVPVVPDTDGPSYFNEVPRNGSEVETAHPVISVEMEDPNGVNTSTVRILIDGADFTAKAQISESRVELALDPADDLSVGEHTVTVSAEDGIGNASSFSWKFRVAERFTGGNHYYGTTHNHTNISHDATGDPEDALIAARFYNYDWFAFSDHSHDIDPEVRGTDIVQHKGMPERTGGAEWQLTKQLSDQYTKDGEFVVFPAFEMTSTTWGHSNVFGADNFIDRVQNGGIYQDLSNYYAWVLTYEDIVAQFNHPTWGGSKPFNGFLPYHRGLDELFTMLEVGNGSGHYSYANAEKVYFQALDLGWHLAPTYGEDNHDATWGQTKKRTVIVAKELTKDALLDAMRKMRVYMTEDPNFRLDVLASGWYMGSTTDTKTLRFDIRGEDPVWEEKSDPKYAYLSQQTNDYIDRVELITNGGVVVDSYKPSGNVTAFSWNPEFTVVGGQQWFVVRVTQKDGDRIYSAPIWSPMEQLAVKVTHLDVLEGGLVGGVPATLEAGVGNMGLIDVSDIRVDFYYDQVDNDHLIGSVDIALLEVNETENVSVVWNNPVPGDRKIIVKLSSASVNLGDNRFEQVFRVKEPLGKTILIDASRNNENTGTDTGSYKDNLKLFTSQMRQAGYIVEENTQPITSDLLQDVDILYISFPASHYTQAEIEAIGEFVAEGGGLFLAAKSRYDKNNDRQNPLLAGIGSVIRINKDEVNDETTEGNFWSNPLNQRWAVRLHPQPAKDHTLNDFVTTIEFYSGASLAADDGNGGLAPLADGGSVTVLVWGNESTFQNASRVEADAARYNVHTQSGSNEPPREDITGGSSIPIIAAETVGQGRIVVSGMNVFNDRQMDESYNKKGNNEFAFNVMNWLAGLETKVTPIRDTRKLPEGTQVVVQGSVTSAAGVFFDAFYVQDDTGGIMAFNEVPDDALQLGDIVRVYGKIELFENNVEIIFGAFEDSVVRIGDGTPVDPVAVSTKDSVSEEHQGKLVKVTGQVAEIMDDLMFKVDDGSGPVLIFVDGYIVNQSGPVPKLEVGDKLEAVGLSGKFSGGDRIRVRNTQELKVVAKRVPVTGIEVNPAELELTQGQTATLTVTIKPDNATIKSVRWSSSDENVAVIQDGVVTAVAPGQAVITAETVDGGYKAAVSVTVRQVPGDDQPGDDQPGDGQPGDGQPGDDQPGDDQPGDGQPGDGQPGDDQPGDDQPGDGQPGDDKPGGGSGDGGTGGETGGASDDGKEGTGILDVTPDSLREGEDGRYYLDVPEDAASIRIPAGMKDQLSQHALVVDAGSVTLTIPASAMKEWTDLPGAGDGQTESILLQFAPISGEESKSLLQAAEQLTGNRISQSSSVYEVSVAAIRTDGTEIPLAEFGSPLELRVRVEPVANPELVAIFRLTDDGNYEYVGGRYEGDGTIRADIAKPGKYVALEVTRPFADLESEHWAYVAVQKLAARQLVKGTSDNTFEPNRPITRAEFALLLVLALNLGESDEELPFLDADRIGDWAKQAVAKAVQSGIIRGDEKGLFRPDAPITRAEMAVMLARALRSAGDSAESGFADDAQIPAWAKGSARALRSMGIIQGRGDGRFEPLALTSRAEAAKAIFNLLEHL